MSTGLDVADLQRAIDLLVDGLDDAVSSGLDLTLERIAARARATTTYTDRTGLLRNSTQSGGTQREGDELVGVVSFAATSERGYLYGLAQEFGTRRGIREKRFIRDAIDAENGELVEGALASAFRSAGFEVR